ncbi:acyl-CoA dehydrogenase family protein [Luminiphilus sp.]|jgi:alkylation response protein AidB-like acyl-CoA dehydrogenase|nr:acyl-CoA dehydrogenase family protein [Luminiphilus sp.]MDA8946908.1 acyl-CoA dehydrogenase family protein [Luminiphilus sp.]MDB2380011.1 acyl-CoA dehydrogenase family protein [Luminiphilus sp.]MDB2440619.1 acyl-CoA dehydrogenase family protein [Luminiphilus sp.]
MENLDQFRVETREWLKANCPDDMRQAMRSDEDQCWGGRKWVFSSEGQQLWLERMAAKGWTAPRWPTEYGGGGLSGDEAKVLREEMARIGARRPLSSFGLDMLGPALLLYATQEQKEQYIPDIINGKIRWCQGYSEPNAGSDLASLRTKAEDMGDYYQINGSKVWTSYADKADWIFCLVRTDFDCPKHEGISFLLFDMASEGVSTKPIKLISGTSPFCETFFDNVQVPKGQLVGTLNKGWEIAKYLLTHEREMIGGFGLAGGGMKGMGQLAAAKRGTVDGRLRDTSLRSEAISFELDEMAFGLTIERITEETKAGQGAGASSSILKMYGTELNKLRQELFMAIGSTDALNFDTDEKGALVRNWLRSKANSIEGGTTEVQLNIIAKRILGLPA